MPSVIFVVALAVTARFSASYILTDRHGDELEDPSLHEWPDACAGKYYCWEKNAAYIRQQKIFDKLLSGESLTYRLGEETDHRQGDVNDLGNCDPIKTEPRTIYMIKDEDHTVWYVAQTVNFTISIQTEECGRPGRITDGAGMHKPVLRRKKLHCVERKIDFRFPVVNKKNEIILRSPHKGLPMSCSAKVLK